MDQSIVWNVVYAVLKLLVTAGAAFFVEYLRRRLGTERLIKIQEELITKQSLANLAVKFAEQSYQQLHGDEKYNKAAEWLAARARELGLKVSADEIKGLIEAALRSIKDEFGEQWANVGKS